MQKSGLALAAVAAFALARPALAAPSVNIEGVLDGGVFAVRDGKDSRTIFYGPASIDFWGSEDLGGGLKAEFLLDTGFDLGSGAATPAPINPSNATPAAPGGVPVVGAFNRLSYVGLKGDFGSLSLGRNYSPVYYAGKDIDALNLDYWGSLLQSVALTGGAERFGRVSNGVFYTFPALGGFTAKAMYSFGSEGSGSGPGSTPPSDANKMWALYGKYETGGLAVSAAYQQLSVPTVAGTPTAPFFTGDTELRKDAIIGAKYKFGTYSVNGGYVQIKQPPFHTKGTVQLLGGSAAFGYQTLSVQLQRIRQTLPFGLPDQTATVLGAVYNYPFSRHTAAYVAFGQVNNGTGSILPLISSNSSVDPGAPGANIRVFGLALRYSFY